MSPPFVSAGASTPQEFGGFFLPLPLKPMKAPMHKSIHLHRILVLGLIVCSLVSTAVAAVVVQERKTKKVQRIKRPNFTQRDWDGVYFEDLFAQGLRGDRPASSMPGTRPTPGGSEPTDVADTNSTEGQFAWSKVISRATIEDEIKTIQNSLATDITTPVKFKSDYAKINRSFSMLSMLFAIIREYDADVRCKEDGSQAQASFAVAAANSRVGTIQAYNSCKRRRDMLTDLVRGGNFPEDEKPMVDMDWSKVVDRTPLMKRLEESMNQIKTLTSSKGEFSGDSETLLRELEMVSAIGLILNRENMTDADDDGYAEFAVTMQQSAAKGATATKNGDYEGASQAANKIGQSCADCHSEWR
jgi:hypothetical protein